MSNYNMSILQHEYTAPEVQPWEVNCQREKQRPGQSTRKYQAKAPESTRPEHQKVPDQNTRKYQARAPERHGLSAARLL